MTPETCPNCGADVAPGAKACPECGSCDETGWSDVAHADSLGLPDDSFDYDRFVADEFGARKKPVRSKGAIWIWLGIVLLSAAVLVALLSR